MLRKLLRVTEKVDRVDECHPAVVRNTRLLVDAVVVHADRPANITFTHSYDLSARAGALRIFHWRAKTGRSKADGGDGVLGKRAATRSLPARGSGELCELLQRSSRR